MDTLSPTGCSYLKHFVALWGQLKCLICINDTSKSKYEAKMEKVKKVHTLPLILSKIDIQVYISMHIYICALTDAYMLY